MEHDREVHDVEDLETEPGNEGTDVDPGDAASDTDAGEDGGSQKTENRWTSRRSLSDIADEVVAEAGKGKEPTPTAGKPAAKPDADPDDEDEDEGADRGGKKDAAKQAGETDPDEDDDDEDDDDEDEDEGREPGSGGGKPRYVVKNAAGEPVDFEWEKDASVVFKGDGKEVVVKSMDELVQLGQKGVAFDRLVPELRSKLTERDEAIGSYEQQLAELQETADRTLLAALFGSDEVKAKLAEALEKYQDPDFVEGQKARAREEQRKKAEEQSEKTELQQSREEFWTSVGTRMGELFERYPLLDENDAPTITERFYKGYESAFTRTYQELVAAGKSKPEAEKLAQKTAFEALSDKNLRRTMRQLNEELQAKLDRKRNPRGGGKPDSETEARRSVEAHNARTNKKIDQSNRPRLGGGKNGGAPPAQVRGAPNDGKPRTFAQRMAGVSRILSEARSPDGGGDSDD
jgi:hypothetical protein